MQKHKKIGIIIDYLENYQKEKNKTERNNIKFNNKRIDINTENKNQLKKDLCENNANKKIKSYNSESESSNEIKQSKEDITEMLKHIEPKGIKNIKGTCYMNTVLQCFFHVEELTEYFLENDMNDKSYFDDKPFSKSYLSVINGLINNKNSFDPKEFYNSLKSINDEYDKYGNDPKNVVYDILLNIHQEEIGSEKSVKLNKNIEKTEKEKLFNYYKEQEEDNTSIISKLFSWCHQNMKRCDNCDEKFFDFEYDNIFLFYLEKISKEKYKNKNGRLNLERDCFSNMFCSKKGSFFCPYCKKNTNGLIEDFICILPKYLIIILDRGKDDNFECPFKFVKTIDLSNFTEIICETNNEKNNFEYELLCVTYLNKKPSHTIAFCKHFNGKYYLFDDEELDEIEFEKIKENKPFLLFYKRV